MQYGDNHLELGQRQLQGLNALSHREDHHCHVRGELKQNAVRLNRYSRAHGHLIHRYHHRLYWQQEEWVSSPYEVPVPKYHLHRALPLEHRLQSREHLLPALRVQRWHLLVPKFHPV